MSVASATLVLRNLCILHPLQRQLQVMNQEDRDALCIYVLVEYLLKLSSRSWANTLHIYTISNLVSQQNALASQGVGFFVSPMSLVQAAQGDRGLRTRLSGSSVNVSFVNLPRRPNISKALAAVLRYDVSGWLKLTALRHLLAARRNSHFSAAQVLASLLSDPRRFEVCIWEGVTWARARYRYRYD